MTVQGHQVRTAAGLSRTEVGSLLRESLVRHGGVQCGFCTPGMMVACVAWLQAPAHADGDAASLRRALAGNICRCTGYSQIVDAARETAAMIAAPGVRELTMKADHEE
jgi:carbon-monoxide dehydrogenase small subunit